VGHAVVDPVEVAGTLSPFRLARLADQQVLLAEVPAILPVLGDHGRPQPVEHGLEPRPRGLLRHLRQTLLQDLLDSPDIRVPRQQVHQLALGELVHKPGTAHPNGRGPGQVVGPAGNLTVGDLR